MERVPGSVHETNDSHDEGGRQGAKPTEPRLAPPFDVLASPEDFLQFSAGTAPAGIVLEVHLLRIEGGQLVWLTVGQLWALLQGEQLVAVGKQAGGGQRRELIGFEESD
jgi:hypothetical protein